MTQPLLIQLWLHTLLPEPAASRFIDSYLTFFSFINFVYVRDGGMNMSQHGYGDQRTVWGGSVLSFHHVESRDQIQVFRFSGTPTC